MRTSIVLGLIIFLSSCASFRQPPVKAPPQKTENRMRRVTSPVKKPAKPTQPAPKESQAVWHLIQPMEVEFVLRHRESNKIENIRAETTLSEIDLPIGNYNIEALMVGAERYDALEGEELFQFEIKKKSPTYVGSYVVECPKVGSLHMVELRKMKFFNRLNFTGNSGTCELIVGNDLENVRRAWSKLENKPGSKLQLGF